MNIKEKITRRLIQPRASADEFENAVRDFNLERFVKDCFNIGHSPFDYLRKRGVESTFIRGNFADGFFHGDGTPLREQPQQTGRCTFLVDRGSAGREEGWIQLYLAEGGGE